MTYKEQLELWVKGESVHDTENDICCPDFSCCNKKINTPIEERLAFKKVYEFGDEKSVNTFLMGYLGQALASFEPEIKVHITDGSYNEKTDC
jgi:hypothetical protein